MVAQAKSKLSASRISHSILGMRLDHVRVEDFIDGFASSARNANAVYCCVPDVHQCMICYDSSEHRAIVNNADYVISDSTVLQTARAIRHGVPRMRTVLGYELTLMLCRKAEEQDIPIALIGGRDDSVLARIQSQLKERFPRLTIAYAYSPPFRDLTPSEEAEMLSGLKASGAKLVFVGVGCPKQERWMGRYQGKLQAALIGVGAAFDTIGGIVSPSPQLVHRLGLEWLFRLCREPRRLFRRYFKSCPRFVCLLFADWLQARFKRAKSA